MTFIKRAAAGSNRGVDRSLRLELVEGVNVLRLYTWQHTVTALDLKLGRYDPRNYPVGAVVEERSVPLSDHWSNGRPAGTCGKVDTYDGRTEGSCRLCDEYWRQLKVHGKTEEVTKMGRTRKQVFVVQNLTEPGVFKFWEAPGSVAAKIDAAATVRRLMKYQDRLYGPNGVDLEVTLDKKTKVPADRYRVEFGSPDDSVELGPFSAQFDPFNNPAYYPTGWDLGGIEGAQVAPKPAKPQTGLRIGSAVRVEFGTPEASDIRTATITRVLPDGYAILVDEPINGATSFEITKEEIIV